MPASRSAVLRGLTDPYSIETLQVDEPGEGEVLVEIVAVGMCHTDLIGRSGMFGDAFLPALLGHEGAGIVMAVGAGVTSVAPGDRIALSYDHCGNCAACLEGQPFNCELFELANLTGTGLSGTPRAHDAQGNAVTSRWFGQSSFGEYAVATERNVVKLPDDLPLDIAGPLGCGIQTGAGAVLNAADLRPGGSIAVFGAGAVGLAAVMAAKVAGAADIVAVDLNPDRLDLARELGATRVVDGAREDVSAVVRGTGPGLDVTFDTTGVGSVMSAAIEVLRRPGRAILVGAGADNLTVHPAMLTGKQVTFIYEGEAVSRTFIPRLIELWRQGLFPMEKLVTRYPLDDIDKAETDSTSGRTIKPVLVLKPEKTLPGAEG